MAWMHRHEFHYSINVRRCLEALLPRFRALSTPSLLFGRDLKRAKKYSSDMFCYFTMAPFYRLLIYDLAIVLGFKLVSVRNGDVSLLLRFLMNAWPVFSVPDGSRSM